MLSRTLRLFRAWLCCLASAPILCAHPLAIDGREPGTELPAQLPLTTWSELSQHPGRYANKRLRLVLQFQSRVATWNPYLTRFGTRDFNAFQFWGDEQRLWNLSEYQAVPVRLFARKRSTPDWLLESAKPYVRFEVEIIVREVFLDQAWAEIESAVRLPEQVSEGTLIHAARATELMQNRSWKLAENELEQALVGGLPAEARLALETLRDDCRRMIAPKGKAASKPAPVLRGKPPPARPKN